MELERLRQRLEFSVKYHVMAHHITGKDDDLTRACELDSLMERVRLLTIEYTEDSEHLKHLTDQV